MIKLGGSLIFSDDLIRDLKNLKKNNFKYVEIFTRHPGSLELNKDPGCIKDNIKKMQILIHASYAINLASPSAEIRKISKDMLLEEIMYAEKNDIKYIILQPGNCTGNTFEEGIANAVDLLKDVFRNYEKNIHLLLETTTGRGRELGGNFANLSYILKEVKDERLGICWDISHLYQAGYDIKNELETVIGNFDKIIGMKKIRVVRISDSNSIGRKDELHFKIGKGALGESIYKIMNHPRLRNKIFILEASHFDSRKEYFNELKTLLKYFSSKGG
jgi:deoxyribonuclease-4